MVDLARSAPEELSIIAFVMHAPPAPFIPSDFVGHLVVMLTLVYAGDPAEGQEVVAPFRSLATPVADLVGPMPYPGIYGFTAESGRRHTSVSRSTFLSGFDADSARTVVDALGAATTPAAMAQIRVLGGAMARVPTGATAFAHRDEPILFVSIAPFEGPAQPHLDWAARFASEVGPKSDGVYVNFLTDEGESRIRAAYPGGAYERLAAIKRRYDPENFFHNNQNVRPASLGRKAVG
jgi:FAD/FMN-containing dehydrogenase